VKLSRIIILAVSFLVVSQSVNAAEKYQVYSDSSGVLYLEAPKMFVLIAAEVSIPLLVRKKNGYLKLTQQGGAWLVESLTESAWLKLSLTAGHPAVSSLQLYGEDGVLLSINGSAAPALLVSNFNSSPIYRWANLDGSTYIESGGTVTYLHTDVLGSIIAETDGSGAVKKRTEHHPYGERKEQ
jgi:hypothetical protein